MCRSEMCRTFRCFPDAFLGTGRGSGLGLANQPVRFRGVVGGSGHSPEIKCEQIIYYIRGETGCLGQCSDKYLSIEPADIRVRNDLRDDRTKGEDAKLRRAVIVELEVLADAHC